MKSFCRSGKLLLSADLRPTLALTKISRVCHAPSASLLFAVGDRRESERARGRRRGPPTAPMRLTRSLRAGNREVNNLRSFGFPFRPRFVSSEARIFRLRFSRNKIRHRDDFGTGERVPRRIKQRRRMDGWANCRSLSPPVGNSQNRGQSAAPSPSAAPMTLSKSV